MMKQYNYNQSNHSIMRIREDTHQLNPNAPFFMSIDSDMCFMHSDYCKSLLAVLYKLVTCPQVGVGAIELLPHFKAQHNTPCILFPEDMTHYFYTDGGLVLRNIPEWEGIVRAELQDLIGCYQDTLIVLERMLNGYEGYSTITEACWHHCTSVGGRVKYGWMNTRARSNSISTYLRQYSDKCVGEFSNSLWKNAPYWVDSSNVWDYSLLSINDLKNMLDIAIQEKILTK